MLSNLVPLLPKHDLVFTMATQFAFYLMPTLVTDGQFVRIVASLAVRLKLSSRQESGKLGCSVSR